MQNPILDSLNKLLKITGLQITGHNSATMDGLPLGVSPSGELAVKTVSTGGASGTGISVPASDYVGYTYYGSTNNVHTAVYKTGGSAGTTVATLTYGYVSGGAANDDLISSVTKS